MPDAIRYNRSIVTCPTEKCEIATQKRTMSAIFRRLRAAYGDMQYRASGSAVGELVATILSQNTSAANASAGFRQLWRRFRSWQAVADAPAGEIERAIRVSGLSNVKAPRIRRILQQIRERNRAAGARRDGGLSLDFLRQFDDRAAYEYLLGFDGVGPKTAACVLLFAFGKPLFPVDTHIVRIAIRLGVLPPGTSAEAAQDLLTPLIRPADRLAMHLLLITHGRRTCRARSPRCDDCALAGMCGFPRMKAQRGRSPRRNLCVLRGSVVR